MINGMKVNYSYTGKRWEVIRAGKSEAPGIRSIA